ncbi:hypothetical protein FRB99_002252 [Tulasnella sp. 403]|nr:hypothetical protein FRB99_002252 [Tulasnella sp. 403]
MSPLTIHRLPVEILQHIVTDTLDSAEWSYPQSVFDLSRVCIYWRQAIESHTLIWSHLNLSFGETWNKLALKKCGTTSLSIECESYTSSASLKGFLDIVADNIHRCRRLVLILSEHVFQQCNILDRISATLQRDVPPSVVFHIAIVDVGRHFIPPDKYSSLSSAVLTQLSLWTPEVGALRNLSTLRIYFSSFTYLSLQQFRDLCGRVQHLIFASPTLRNLDLYGPRGHLIRHFDYSSLPSPVPLPELTRISFRDIHPQFSNCLLTSIHPTNLKWLEISHTGNSMFSTQYLLAQSHPQLIKSLNEITRNGIEEATIRTKPSFYFTLQAKLQAGFHVEAPCLSHSHEPIQLVLSLIPQTALDTITCITISFPDAGSQELCDLLRSHFPSICHATLEVSNSADWQGGIGFLSTPGVWPRLDSLTVYASEHTKVIAHDLLKFLRARVKVDGVGGRNCRFRRLEVFDADVIQPTAAQMEQLLTLVDDLSL